jgi:PAS domain S-box-containing protein
LWRAAGTRREAIRPRRRRDAKAEVAVKRAAGQRVIEERLHQSEERFRMMVESVKDYAIFVLDETGHVMSWNRGAEIIKGYTADEIIGEHFSRFYPEEDVARGKCEMELRVATGEGRFEDEGWRVRKDGTLFWANVVITALRDRLGNLIGFGKVTRDLSDRRRLELERLRTERAKEAVRLRDEFLSIASHELKTPLTILQLQLQNLREAFSGSVDSERKLERALRSGKRLAELIDTLFDVSRLSHGRVELNRETFDLVVVARDVTDRCREVASRAGCEILVSDPGPILVYWDPLRIEQVFLNLIGNALKYGAGEPIELTLSRNQHDIVIDVRDHGPGIPEDDLGRIFDRFERAVSFNHYGGLGLGLFVTQQITRAHGGEVTARNEPAGGARLTVRIPNPPAEGTPTTGTVP